LVSNDETELLIAKYGEQVAGTVSYFKMNADVNRKNPKPQTLDSILDSKLVLDDKRYNNNLPVGK
jgi:hypothetical protein